MLEILIVEDHPLIIDGLTKLLSTWEKPCKISTAGTGKDCRVFMEIYTPDLILMDINLPDASGIDLCKEIHRNHPEIKIVALTTFNEKTYIRKMLEAGASGYMLKNSLPEEIIAALDDVLSGKIFLALEAQSVLKAKEASVNRIVLTNREKEVLYLIADGLTNQEIGDKLFISPLTVDSHRKNLILKLNAKNTASLVKNAAELGFFDVQH